MNLGSGGATDAPSVVIFPNRAAAEANRMAPTVSDGPMAPPGPPSQQVIEERSQEGNLLARTLDWTLIAGEPDVQQQPVPQDALTGSFPKPIAVPRTYHEKLQRLRPNQRCHIGNYTLRDTIQVHLGQAWDGSVVGTKYLQ